MSRKTFRLHPETLENRVLPSCWAMGVCVEPPPNHADSHEIGVGGHAVLVASHEHCGEIRTGSSNHEAGIIKGCGNIGDIIKGSEVGCGGIKHDGFPYIEARIKGCGEVIDKPPYENGAGKLIMPVAAHDQVMAAYGCGQSGWVPIK